MSIITLNTKHMARLQLAQQAVSLLARLGDTPHLPRHELAAMAEIISTQLSDTINAIFSYPGVGMELGEDAR